MQRPAKPWTPVRFRPPPPVLLEMRALELSCTGETTRFARVVKLVDTGDLKSPG